jgi:hypothetical protein
MKKLYLFLNVFIVLSVIFLNYSCKKDDEKKEDPIGTVTTNINTTVNSTPITLYSGASLPGDYYLAGTDTIYFNGMKVTILFGIDNNINFQIIHHYSDYSNWGWFPNEGGEFIDIGEVDGLGYVESIPQSGWGQNVAAIKGHGYVMRYKHSKNINDSKFPDFYYARLYVEDYLTSSTTGGTIGIVLKYKHPF